MIKKRTTDRVTKQAAPAVRPIGSGNSFTRRKNVTTGGVTITTPAKATSAVFKNPIDNANDIRLRINAVAANYWTLKPGEMSPKVAVNRTTIQAVAIGAAAPMEIIFEG